MKFIKDPTPLLLWILLAILVGDAILGFGIGPVHLSRERVVTVAAVIFVLSGVLTLGRLLPVATGDEGKRGREKTGR